MKIKDKREIVYISLKKAIEILNYHGVINQNNRIKLDTPEKLFKAVYLQLGGRDL